jgi:murein DD-endopeptidase MepM/ murein hydrolase activator NlpD
MANELAYNRVSFAKRLAHAFRERHVYLRSDGRVRFILLKPWIQISFLLLLCAVIGLITYAFSTVAFKNHVIAAQKQQFSSEKIVYEDHLTQMFSSMDRLNSQLLLNQDNVESQLNKVRKIQSDLERRQNNISSLMSEQFSVSMNALEPPMSEELQIVEAKERSTLLITFEPTQPDVRFSRITANHSAVSINDAETVQATSQVSKRLRELYSTQKIALNMLETHSTTRVSELEEAIMFLGFKPERFAQKDVVPGLGGPLVHLTSSFDGDGTPLSASERQIKRIVLNAETISTYLAALKRFPMLNPINANARVSSKFGQRSDPFTNTKAMHQGIDYACPNGTPVIATAPGQVNRAGWSDAYGYLIEITHDNGVSTRYAHLSKIGVNPGQQVEAGQEIGFVGSTGRSSGPHLHYETRTNGTAVNPAKFYRVATYVFQ